MAAYVQFGDKLKLMSDLAEARGAIIRRLFAKQGLDVGSTSHGRPRVLCMPQPMWLATCPQGSPAL